MHDSHGLGLSGPLQTGIGLMYFLVMLMNVGFALYQYYDRKNQLQAIVWGVVAAVFGIHAVAYLAHLGWAISDPGFSWLQHGIDYVMGPVTYFVLAVAGFLFFVFSGGIFAVFLLFRFVGGGFGCFFCFFGSRGFPRPNLPRLGAVFFLF